MLSLVGGWKEERRPLLFLCTLPNHIPSVSSKKIFSASLSAKTFLFRIQASYAAALLMVHLF